MATTTSGFVNGTPREYMAIIQKASDTHGIPTNILSALLKQESGFAPDVISGKRRSSAGAQGIAQFMPATAKRFGINPLNPDEAIMAAAQYLKMNLERFGNIELALAAYNAGEGNVQKYGGVPPFKETQNYVKNITAMAGKSEVKEEDLKKQGYQHIGEDAYYKRDASKPGGYEIVRTGKKPAPTPMDLRLGGASRPGADASLDVGSATKRLMESIAPPAYAAETPTAVMSTVADSASRATPLGGPPKRSYTQQYADEYNAPYTVKSGDTLWGIAERTLGSGQRWKELGYTGDPKQLPVGTVLNNARPSTPAPVLIPGRMSSSGGAISSSGRAPASRVPMPPRSMSVPQPVQMAPPVRSTPLKSMPIIPSFSAPKSVGQSAQLKPSFVQSSAKPIQSSAGGGNVVSRLINSVTNLFRR